VLKKKKGGGVGHDGLTDVQGGDQVVSGLVGEKGDGIVLSSPEGRS